MAQRYHVAFLEEHRDLLQEPVLLVGSRQYDYDVLDLGTELRRLGVEELVGIDILDGPGVDAVVDITDTGSAWVDEHAGSFGTVICMEVLTHLPAPFVAAATLQRLARPGGTVILSECIVRKFTRMPGDYWRFTHDGLAALFDGVDLDPERARLARTRDKDGRLEPLGRTLPEVLAERHPHESKVGHLVRRAHRRFFAKGDFELSRLLPELTILAAGRRRDDR
jgi:hypothetical protein